MQIDIGGCVRIHHFFPKTHNIGDHFVQRGVEWSFVTSSRKDCFDINSRGTDPVYGLTHPSIERANSEADMVVIDGSNLTKGASVGIGAYILNLTH